MVSFLFCAVLPVLFLWIFFQVQLILVVLPFLSLEQGIEKCFLFCVCGM